VTQLGPGSDGTYCYSVRFGSQDSTGGEGLEHGVSCPSAARGCYGDFTRIFTNTGANDLGVEVRDAVDAIRASLGNNVQVALLGHSRGGLAARAFLQVSQSSQSLSAVVALVTTGTPHQGSPLGRIYRYLETYCLDSNHNRIHPLFSDCADDWQGVDTVLGLSLTFGGDMNLERPGIAYLSPDSPDIQTLDSTRSILTGRGIQIIKLAYTGKYLGHLATGYSVWDRDGLQYFDQFSDRSKRYALCGSISSCTKSEDDPEFSGDGIVPESSQAATNIGGTLTTYSGGAAYHTDEPKRLSNLNTALNQVRWR
jgi:pimeloyl-ACP methyl ester carboxylesterase